MCITCWEERGKPQILNSNVMKAAALIHKVYEHSGVGGNLHIVLDDWNIEKKHIDWCIKTAIPENMHELSESELKTERDCAELLLSMPLKERAAALAFADGYFEDGTSIAVAQPRKDGDE